MELATLNVSIILVIRIDENGTIESNIPNGTIRMALKSSHVACLAVISSARGLEVGP